MNNLKELNWVNLKATIKHWVETGPEYAMSMSTLTKKMKVSNVVILGLSKQLGYNVFIYDGIQYVGTEKKRQDYYFDKFIGQNPFYQTS